MSITLAIAEIEAPPRPDPRGAGVEVWRDSDGVVCAYGHRVRGVPWMHLPGVASFRIDGDVVTAAPDRGASPETIADTFERSVLPMALHLRGGEVLHASAVVSPGGVVAFCAISQTGKSTVAYGLSERGLPLWADDAVAFEASRRGGLAIPLPFTLRLRRASAAFFRRGAIVAAPGLRDPAPLAAVCVLERAEDAAPEIRRLAPAAAFPAVLAHAYCFSLHDRERTRAMMRHYLDLVAAVPVHQVRFPTGLEHLREVLDGIERTWPVPVSA